MRADANSRLRPWTAAVAVAAIITAGAVARAQSFEVASIRLSTLPRQDPGLLGADVEADLIRAVVRGQNGRFRTTGSTVHALVQGAYAVRKDEIEGGPSWIREDRYAIDARGPGTATEAEMRAMLQALLADRFGLVLRRRTINRPVYELVVAAGGPRITPMQDGDCLTSAKGPIAMNLDKPVFFCGGIRRMVYKLPPDRADRIEAGGVTMAMLADVLADDVGRRVIDRTGLTTTFNLLIDFAPMGSVAPGTVSSTPNIFTVVQEQLGLRLQSTTAPVDVLVIEQVERPSEN